ncbi:hypothetical protein [Parachitinimonas caeni]|uniref:VCBS repeat-containing protein n=1 Tax=Parachitinimonas caeni TaxID=3031301 RepID=A0ABT7E0K1_9NEIS|nr:hypothetical protein [Parachitinimonas caeni]MDK2125589.1 hypothetical protein [Parachitinimonas caeni]
MSKAEVGLGLSLLLSAVPATAIVLVDGRQQPERRPPSMLAPMQAALTCAERLLPDVAADRRQLQGSVRGAFSAAGRDQIGVAVYWQDLRGGRQAVGQWLIGLCEGGRVLSRSQGQGGPLKVLGAQDVDGDGRLELLTAEHQDASGKSAVNLRLWRIQADKWLTAYRAPLREGPDHGEVDEIRYLISYQQGPVDDPCSYRSRAFRRPLPASERPGTPWMLAPLVMV